MIQIVEVPDINFLDYSDSRLVGHIVEVTDTIDNSMIELLITKRDKSSIPLIV